MYEASDETIIIEQRTSINEHLNRGVKDFAIHLCSIYYIPILHRMIVAKPSEKNQIWLRHIYHGLKNLVVEIRLGGQMLHRFDDQDVYWLQQMIDIIGEFNANIKKDGILYDLYKKCQKEYFVSL
jgi:hypothetical protein